MPEHLHKHLFEPQLHTPFQLVNEPTALELIEVSGAGARGEWESFSLLFRGPLDAPLQQGTWELRHEQLGEIALFLVPTAQNAQGIEYEAVFNRFIEAEAGNSQSQ